MKLSLLATVAVTVAVPAAVGIASRNAEAHIALNSPTARFAYSAGGIKIAPCATGTASNAITHVRAGQSLTVNWTETVYHPGFFRISINTAGTDTFPAISPTPVVPMVAPVVADNIFPHTSGSSGAARSFTVTVPNVTCAKCTLQLTQFMSDNPTSGYYNCADIAIDPATGADAGTGAGGAGAGAAGGRNGGAAGGTSGGAAGGRSGGAAGGESGGAAGGESGGALGGASGGALGGASGGALGGMSGGATGGTSGVGTTGGTPGVDAGDSTPLAGAEGGCACASAGGGSVTGFALVLALLVTTWTVRTRRRGGRSRLP